MIYTKLFGQCIAALILSSVMCYTEPQASNSTIAEEIRAWRKLKYGMFIHYSLSTFDGKEQTPGSSTPVSIHKPTELDVDQWIRVAKESGMKYAVLTAKHSSGFCLWDSKVQWKSKEFDYDVAASPVATDVVAEFMTACEKYGIVPGIYYCTMDTRHSDKKIKWTPSLPYISNDYFQLMKDHLTELHTKYPSIKIQWIDIPRHLTLGQRTTLYNLVRNLSPPCLILYNYGQESRDISEYTIKTAMKVSWPSDILNSEITPIKKPFKNQQEYKGQTYELAYEHCISLDKGGWFWDGKSKPRSLENLTSVYKQSLNLNGNFLLNVPPDKTGKIPEAFVQRLSELKSSLGLVNIHSSFNQSGNNTDIEFNVSKKYTHPHSHCVMITFDIHEYDHSILKICNILGQETAILVNGYKAGGKHTMTWQPKGIPGGTYFVRLQTGTFSKIKKIILQN